MTLSERALVKMGYRYLGIGGLALMKRFRNDVEGEKKAVGLISKFFSAVQAVFSDAWVGHAPKSSRLVHGAGIMAMHYVMEHLIVTENAYKSAGFAEGLGPRVGEAAWTDGLWVFRHENVRPWNSLQVVSRDWMELAEF